MSTHYIFEYTLPNKFKIHVIAEALRERTAKAAVQQLIDTLQNNQTIQVHQAIKMITPETPVKVEKWARNERLTSNARKEFLIYFLSNNIISGKIEMGNGIKSAYNNFREMQRRVNDDMGGYYKVRTSNAIVIIDMNQQIPVRKQASANKLNLNKQKVQANNKNIASIQREFIKDQQPKKQAAEKILQKLVEQSKEFPEDDYYKMLVFKSDSLYWLGIDLLNYSLCEIKVIIYKDRHKMNLIEELIGNISGKGKIMAYGVIVSRDFVDNVQLKCGPDGISKLYEAISGNLVFGIRAGTSIGQELKDPGIVEAMFEIDDGTVWSKRKSIQAWKNMLDGKILGK